MDSSPVTALAQRYAKAAEQVRDSEFKIRNSVMRNALNWSGKGREQFDDEYQELIKRFDWCADEFLETSSQLQKAASLIDQYNAELEAIERAKELAALELSCKKPII